jgi:hypothetical protein
VRALTIYVCSECGKVAGKAPLDSLCQHTALERKERGLRVLQLRVVPEQEAAEVAGFALEQQTRAERLEKVIDEGRIRRRTSGTR